MQYCATVFAKDLGAYEVFEQSGKLFFYNDPFIYLYDLRTKEVARALEDTSIARTHKKMALYYDKEGKVKYACEVHIELPHFDDDYFYPQIDMDFKDVTIIEEEEEDPQTNSDVPSWEVILYPNGDAPQKASFISVEEPRVVQLYDDKSTYVLVKVAGKGLEVYKAE